MHICKRGQTDQKVERVIWIVFGVATVQWWEAQRKFTEFELENVYHFFQNINEMIILEALRLKTIGCICVTSKN